jgi:hypothetical protein
MDDASTSLDSSLSIHELEAAITELAGHLNAANHRAVSVTRSLCTSTPKRSTRELPDDASSKTVPQCLPRPCAGSLAIRA